MAFVYFIENKKSNAIKIGFTKNSPEKRLKQLQTGCADKLELIYVVEGTFDVEYFMHRRFEDFRIKGEWFKAEPIKAWIRTDKLIKEYQK